MKPTLFDILPPSFRRRGCVVVATIFLRALLNFVGLAMLLPVLLLILDTQSIRENEWLGRLYALGGFADERSFVVAVCAAVVAVIVVKSLLSLLLFKVERNYIYDLYRYLSRRLYVGYHNAGLGFIKRNNSALLARNVNAVCMIFISGVLQPLAAIVCEALLFLLLFGALALYSPATALLIVAIFLPAVWIYYAAVRRQLIRYGEREDRAQRKKARTVIDTFRGYADIEINNAFPRMLETFDDAMEEVITVKGRNDTVAMLPRLLTEIGLSIGMALLIIINLGLGSGRMQLLFGIFAVAALRLMPSVRSIMSCWTSIKYNRFTIEILREAEAETGAAEYREDARRMRFDRQIEVDALSFRFEDGDEEVLSRLSLTIRKGERLGIRGASGAGKTTLFNLLLGLYEPVSGRILIDGEPLTAANRRAWQNAIGYVSQQVFLIDGTFAENIALGCPEASFDRERIAEALRTARLWEFVEQLPAGMDTPIGECGCRLSGGQRQRIGIARALYKQAEILFFDEATSSLDNHTEEQINSAIEELSRADEALTIVVIAHRESSLAYCDRVITIG